MREARWRTISINEEEFGRVLGIPMGGWWWSEVKRAGAICELAFINVYYY